MESNRIKKILAILLVVLFVATTTATACSPGDQPVNMNGHIVCLKFPTPPSQTPSSITYWIVVQK